MYLRVKGTFENGHVVLNEPPPTAEKTEVVVMFFRDENDDQKERKGVRQVGSLKKLGEREGKVYSIPDDFNDPLDDLKDYM